MSISFSSRLAIRVLVLLAALATFAAGLGPASARAAGTTFYVAKSGLDRVSCGANSATAPFATIERALACAADGDVISLGASSQPYAGIGTVSTSVTIKGSSARTTTVDAGLRELFVNAGAEVTVSGITLTCHTNCAGIPTVTNEGSLTLSSDAVTGNVSIAEAAILNTTPSGSSTPASLTIDNSTVSGNQSKFGAVQTNTGIGATGASTLAVTNSTIANNASIGDGGGIAALAVTPGSGTTVVNSTLAGNTASTGGGLYASSPTTLSNTIIAGNSEHGAQSDCRSNSDNSIITDGPGGHNLIGNLTGCGAIRPGLASGDQTGVTHPGLLPLANNGGPTQTVALQAASPAIGTADQATCTSDPLANLDQRGHTRVTPTRGCDIGAYDSAGVGVVHAKYFVAPSGSDAGACSDNRAAAPFATIQRALACAVDGDVVSVAPGGAVPYAGIGPVAANVTIKGASARTVSIDAGSSPLSVDPAANVIVSGVMLTCQTNCGGAPTVTDEGRLSLVNDAITANTGVPTAAVLATTPDGSASAAALSVTDSTITGNDSKLGGAIQTSTGAGATGPTMLDLVNSTLAGNVSLQTGGGIAALAITPGSGATIVNSTITGNTASFGGGLYAASPTTLSNTIIAANAARDHTAIDCASSPSNSEITDGPGGHNLIGDSSGCGMISAGANGDQAGSDTSPLDPRLGPLAINGGTTRTELPLAGSPAIGGASAATCEQAPVFDADQRHANRKAPARDVCDIGAVDTGGTTRH